MKTRSSARKHAAELLQIELSQSKLNSIDSFGANQSQESCLVGHKRTRRRQYFFNLDSETSENMLNSAKMTI